MSPDLLYQVALTKIPGIGPVQARILLQHCNPEEIFHAKKHFLERIEGIGSVKAGAIISFKDFTQAEQEIRFMEHYGIKPLFITDPAYPKRLLNCYDPPTLLYYKGRANLNASKMISLIGTRNHTEYARQVTEKLVKELAGQQVTIISGLAFGVDALAHRAALKNNLPTVGVLAHGLDHVYPFEHRSLARDMLDRDGGLLSEFPVKTKPDKHNFPMRNRVVAGMTDATIVIETDIRGGSMITAELANNYNKDVFAIPGKITDIKSAGCNYLIRQNKAVLLTSAAQLLEELGWEEQTGSRAKKKIQKELLIDLSADEWAILEILKQKAETHIDEINLQSRLSSSAVAAAILNLELKNALVSLPGKLYRLA
jgi:DNA processing protein